MNKKKSRPYTPIFWSNDSLQLLVKIYPNGELSSYLVNMKIGDEIRVRGPYGNFLYIKNRYVRFFLVIQTRFSNFQIKFIFTSVSEKLSLFASARGSPRFIPSLDRLSTMKPTKRDYISLLDFEQSQKFLSKKNCNNCRIIGTSNVRCKYRVWHPTK